MPDVAIIGAGPAGSAAALLLARAGWNVTLIEQHTFPRDKVCGECLSALGISVLHRLKLHDAIQVHSPALLTHASLHAPDGPQVRLPLAAPMWGISRRLLDALLLDTARNAGALVLQPARCEAIDPSQSPLQLVVRDLRTNRRATVRADHVLIADGKGALLGHRPAPTSDFGIKAHFVEVASPRDTIALFGVRNRYGGIAPIEQNRWNIAFSIPVRDLTHCGGDLDRLFDAIFKQNRELTQCFATAKRISDWLAAPLPRFAVAKTWPPRVIPLGNAAAALEPIGGEGIGLAMRSAELAAQSLIADPTALDRPDLRREFNRLWQLRRAACRAAAKMLSSPSLAGPTVEFLASNESLGRAALRLMGKGEA